MRILYIHGANATELTFEFIRQNLPTHTGLCANYSVDTPIVENIQNIEKLCIEEYGKKPFHIIAHSMGGLIALKLINNKKLNIKKLITLSTPFNGHRFAEFLKWVFPGYRLYDDISPSSDFIKEIQKMRFDVPIQSIVSINGYNPVFRQPNDGVVTVESQLTLKDAEFFEIDLCHFEILLSKDVVIKIEEFFFTKKSSVIVKKKY